MRPDLPTSGGDENPIRDLQRLNLGCGPDAPAGWLNLDGSWNAWFSHHPNLRKLLKMVGFINAANQGSEWNVRPIVHDLTQPLPFPDNSFSAIYASHVLEHLYLVEAQRLLLECKRVAKPGGVVRIIVPDLRSMAQDYLRANGETHIRDPKKVLAADHLNERLALRSASRPGGNPIFKFYAIWKDFHSHKWMYDSDSLCSYMREAGFADVRARGYLESEVPGVAEIEVAERVLNGAGVCVEGKKA
jgi:SAM-dependent methyltransferase